DYKFANCKHRLELLTAKIDGLSPTARLVNGFGYIEGDIGAVTSVNSVNKGDEIRITLHDGIIDATVKNISAK
ncbi:MAG: exodeoxyribonuclease VII large subunit, partial [Wujia sp.]